MAASVLLQHLIIHLPITPFCHTRAFLALSQLDFSPFFSIIGDNLLISVSATAPIGSFINKQKHVFQHHTFMPHHTVLHVPVRMNHHQALLFASLKT
jgi:hypothetical protein